MVLRRGHGQSIFAIAKNEKTGFFAGQKFLNDQFGTSLTKSTAKNIINRFMRLLQSFGNNHPFASRQPIGFNNNWRALPVEIIMRRLRRVKPTIGGGGNISLSA